MLSEADKAKIAAIKIRAADLRDKRDRQFPYEGTVPRKKGQDYRPIWLVLRDWLLYIVSHGVMLLLPVVVLFGMALVLYLIEGYMVQLVLAALILGGAWGIYCLNHRPRPGRKPFRGRAG